MNIIAGELWYKIPCPDEECKVINFVYGGYFLDSDNSKLDADGFTCWSCKKDFIFFEDEFADPEGMHFQEGQPVSVFWTIH